jgi:4-aminobutyrate aminotransferase-like enzyme
MSLTAKPDATPGKSATSYLTSPPIVPDIVRGSGCHLIAADGTKYFDAASGTFNVPLGYDHKDVVDAVTRQLSEISHLSSTFSATRAQSLLTDLLSHAPERIDNGWLRDITGSGANECALKVASKATGRTDVVSLFMSHHGQTEATAAISGNAFRRKDFPGTTSPYSIKVPAPYCYRCFYGATYPSCGLLCVERINDFIEYASNDSLACMIVEPVLGNGGNIVPPKGYFEAVNKLCTEHSMLLIADEVQTGIGRTGHMFASTALGMAPNVITLAKGLGGIGIPVAAVLFEKRLNVLASHDHSFTSGANPLALAAAEATLNVVSRPSVLDRVRINGAWLGHRLRVMAEEFPFVGDVRGLGYMWGLEIDDVDGEPDPPLTQAIIRNALEKRLILRGSRYGRGNVIKIRPALTASDDDLDEMLTKLQLCLEDFK